MKPRYDTSLVCPYWLEESHRCSIVRNGIFIPLATHFTTYCISAQHTSCSHYRQEQSALQAEREGIRCDRRQHERTPSAYPLKLRFLSDSNKTIWHAAETAETVNLSSGGMQISTRTPLFSDSIIRFSHNNMTPSWRRIGLARVRWCLYNRDGMHYVAGLCYYTFKALRRAHLIGDVCY